MMATNCVVIVVSYPSVGLFLGNLGQSLSACGADSGADGIAHTHADLAVCHDRPGGHPGDHPLQHLGGPPADQGPPACCAED